MFFVKKNFQYFGNNLPEVIYLKFLTKLILFYLGGMGYVGLELLWRRRSSSSMFVLGGICFLALGALSRSARRIPALLKSIIGALIITTLELAAGFLVNRDHRIWDYTGLPMHYRGQICLPYTLLWIPVAGFAMWLYDQLSRAMDHSAAF